jgi:hypothetical protein
MDAEGNMSRERVNDSAFGARAILLVVLIGAVILGLGSLNCLSHFGTSPGFSFLRGGPLEIGMPMLVCFDCD